MEAVRVEWLPVALADRDAIITYLEPLNPHAAIILLQDLQTV
jgi:plasmid stabilization system protein ParE